MNEPPSLSATAGDAVPPSPGVPPLAAAPDAGAVPPGAAPGAAPAALLPGRWIAVAGVVLAALSAAALVYAWNTQQRVKALETLLVKRQEESAGQSTEARLASRQAQELARESAAKLALLEARVAETTIQRSQLEDLLQSMARSRDENVLADVDAAVRVAMQQSAITGSVEPLLAALRSSDERLARYSQPRLERVRRASAQDVDRVRAAGAVDLTMLTIRLDELIRQLDDLPLVSAPERRTSARGAAPVSSAPRAAAAPAGAASAAERGWGDWVARAWDRWGEQIWQEVRALVRVTRIDVPEAMLVAPDQAFFLRENLKLRLLNARLALLSRQFDVAQSDLRDAQSALERYFERSHRRVAAAIESLRQTAAQSRQLTQPRPDATLAAIATATAGR